MQNTFVRGNQLSHGMELTASYNAYNKGTDRVKILAIEVQGRQFTSVKAAMGELGVKKMSEFEEYEPKLVVQDLETKETGDWYYVFEGRWCRGSGAEALTFRKIS